ncbi:Transcriptional activator FeaR [Pseudomonas fluorescens]|uniref:Transcriptional activator FeaR n=1 Tax=Pseudomonas fluorescens TaxID=294 RepID=A0A5E7WJB9_PSEFL|nr:hypothetical protein [Pseudomonas fluorescens]VVQ35469.1 Transcriptional activator FeaR [Pseudomonas fluorescens]
MKDIRTNNDDFYFLVHQLQGSAVLQIEGHTVQLEPGDMVVLDAAKPSDFNFLSVSRQTAICLPRQIVEKTYSAHPKIVGRKISGKTNLGSVIGPFVQELFTLLNSPKDEVEAMHRALLALLRPFNE